ncbi:MAG TPA: tetratricopeptide repeat protein [Opitutaceae bacterium]|nr:tetratricopeptide repeat protein [Opitutaceae bacterium]
MPDVPVSALDSRQQKLMENARVALANRNYDYVVEACSHVLRAVPGCVEARRLQRTGQLGQFETKNQLVAKVVSGLSSTPFIFSSVTKDPAKALGSAEKILASDPTSASALKLLAEAAMAMDFPETAAFAREAAHEQEPDDHGNLLQLGEAWLAAGRPQDALRTADTLLRLKPLDSAAQNLMRKAAIAKTSRESGWDGWTRSPAAAKPEMPPAGLALKSAAPEDELRKELVEAVAAVAREPEHLDHYRAIVDRYRQLGEPAEALAWLRKGRKLPAGAVDMALERQESELSVTLLELQVKAAQSELVASPGDPEVETRLAAAKRELASFRLFEARRNVERRPNDLAARQTLGLLYLERGQNDEAIAQFQEAQKNPAVRTAALLGLARAYRAKKLPDLAVAQFVLAKAEFGPQLDEPKKEVIYQLGECYEQLGRREQAVAEFKQIYAEDVVYRDVAARINAYYGK